MIGYIRGIVTKIDDSYILLENNNIGYKIFVPAVNNYVIGNEYQVFIYNHQKPEEYLLYGFLLEEELKLFEKVINVKGIGPKMGLKFLAGGSYDKLINAINDEDIAYLKSIPKVGDKMARQLILELKNSFSNRKNQGNNLVSDALKSLGYKSSEISQVMPFMDSSKSVEDNIKICLKHLKK